MLKGTHNRSVRASNWRKACKFLFGTLAISSHLLTVLQQTARFIQQPESFCEPEQSSFKMKGS